MSARPVRTLVVAGGGSAAWTAAIVLHRAFARTGLSVTVAELAAPDAQDAVATLPDLARFHRLLGLDERQLLSGADAVHALGQEFAGWSGDASAFLHGFGETGRAIGDLPFVQSWVRARAGGLPAAFEAFSTSVAAARAGRMPPPDPGGAVPHGYHLDMAGYVAVLKTHAIGLGVTMRPFGTPQVEAKNGRIVAIRDTGGQRLAGDLFVDATGPDALLLRALDPEPIVADATGRPDRTIAATIPAMMPLPLYSRVAAHTTGWTMHVPLASRTSVSFAYSSRESDDEGAVAAFARQLGQRATMGEPQPLRHAMRTRPWVGNCVAIGAAACSGEPIDGATMQREQIAIAQLVALFPVDRARMAEAAIYNEEVVAHHRRIDAFQAAHYRLNGRDEPFWRAARERPIDAELEWKIALFQARGMVAQYNQESFHSDSWQTLLIGHGVRPRGFDPQAYRTPDATVAGELRAILSDVAGAVSRMAPYAEVRARIGSKP